MPNSKFIENPENPENQANTENSPKEDKLLADNKEYIPQETSENQAETEAINETSTHEVEAIKEVATHEVVVENEEIIADEEMLTQDVADTADTAEILPEDTVENTSDEKIEMPQYMRDDVTPISVPILEDEPQEEKKQKVKTKKEDIQNTIESKSLWAKLGTLVALICLVALFTLPQVFHNRPLWYSDEVRHAAVYQQMENTQEYLVLELNGNIYTDKPPLYFWILSALDKIPNVDNECVFFISIALSVLLFVFATYCLALAVGSSARVALGAGCIALTSALPFALTLFSRMDMLFAALCVFSFACFFKAWIKKSAVIWLVFAFLFMGVACFVKGPLALLFPFVASIVFLLWRGTFKRINDRDGILGFLLLLLMGGTWFGLYYFTGNAEYLSNTFNKQIIGRTVNTWIHAGNWYYYLLYLPLLLLPYTLIPLFANWKKTCTQLGTKIKKSRFPAMNRLEMEKALRIEEGETKATVNPVLYAECYTAAGTAWLYALAISGLIVLTFVSSKLAIYLLPFFPVYAILLSKALMNFTARASRWFFGIFSFVSILIGILLMLLYFYPALIGFVEAQIPQYYAMIPNYLLYLLFEVKNIAYLGIVFFIGGLILWKGIKRSYPQYALVFTTVIFGAAIFVSSFFIFPSLNTILSTKDFGTQIATHVQEDYYPVSYNIYSGVFTYYAKTNLYETNKVDDFLNTIELKAKTIIVMPLSSWNKWTESSSNPRPVAVQEIDRQYIMDREYVLATYTHSLQPESMPSPESQENTLEETVSPPLPIELQEVPPELQEVPLENSNEQPILTEKQPQSEENTETQKPTLEMPMNNLPSTQTEGSVQI